MTTDIDIRRESSALELLPPTQTPAAAAVAMLREHAELMSMAYDLADKMCQTKLVPTRFFRKPEDGTAAILYGLELGLNPIQSLQRVIPIHGMPTLESLTMVALLEARGFTIKTVEESEIVCEVHGWKPGRDPNTDEPDAKSRWTIERAIKAQYVPRPSSPDSKCRPEVDADWVTVTKTWDGKSKTSVVGNMKYITDPQGMLVAKCQARVCKAIGSSVLLGIAGSTEEMRSEQRRDDDEPTRVESTRQEPVTVEEVLGDPDTPGKRPAKSSSRLGDKIKPAPAATESTEESPQQETRDGNGDTNEVETQVEDTTADPAPGAAQDSDAGQGGGNDQSQGAEPSAGTANHADSGDQDADLPTPGKPQTAKRKALESRMFQLISAIRPKVSDDDRIDIYRAILDRPEVTSTDHLTDEQVGKVSDELYAWMKDGDIDVKVRDILMAADARATAEDEGK